MKQISKSADKLKEKRDQIGNKKSPQKETAVPTQEIVPADDASALSALSFGLSEAGSQFAGSLVGSVKSGARDSDSEISILKLKYAGGAVEKFKLETCTVIVFVSLTGSLTEYPLNKRITSYSELQREIARLQPKSRKMFVIQDISGAPISAKYFTGYDLIRVKEISIKPNYKILKDLPLNWEQTGYHDVLEDNNGGQYNDNDDNFSFASHPSELD